MPEVPLLFQILQELCLIEVDVHDALVGIQELCLILQIFANHLEILLKLAIRGLKLVPLLLQFLVF